MEQIQDSFLENAGKKYKCMGKEINTKNITWGGVSHSNYKEKTKYGPEKILLCCYFRIVTSVFKKNLVVLYINFCV